MNRIASQQVCWFAVHEFVQRSSASDEWPLAGTPAWCALDDDDPAKLTAVLAAGTHWALRVDTFQQELAAASREIADMENWASLSRRIINQHSRIPRKAAS